MKMLDEFEQSFASIPEAMRRRVRTFEGGAAPYLTIAGKRLVNLASNNYLSLATDPEVIEAAVAAARRYGAGAGSSRLIAGTTPLVESLEARLADVKQAGAALVTSSGYTAALAAITSLVGEKDGIAIEKGAHSCLISGAELSGAAALRFRRENLESLDRALAKLRRTSRRLLIVVDGVHSMDGDIAPLPSILELAEKHDALLLVDDAHGTGTLGPRGEGIFAHYAIAPPSFVIQMGTLSKALGSQGGFLAADAAVIRTFVQNARAFIYTTGLAPAAVGAAAAALEIMLRDGGRVRDLRQNTEALCAAIDVESKGTPIVPMLLGDERKAVALAARLEEEGCLTLPIRPPTVPKGTSRLRLSVQSGHRHFVEASDHAAQERYLVLLRRRSAE